MNYEHRIVAFIDILAFASLLKKTRRQRGTGNSFDNEEVIEKLFKVFKRIRYLMGVDEPSDDIAESRRVSQFSDSVFISFIPEEEPKEFQYLLGELLYLHVELVRHNILIRGGVAYGPMIHAHEIIFGPALVQAYKLESSAAISPRIILPQSLYKSDSEFNKLIIDRGSTAKLEDLLSLDEDDYYYLDYFDKCQLRNLGIFTNDINYINHLIKLKEVITKGLKSAEPGIYSKYGWMKSKWNRTISKYKSPERLELLKLDGKNDLHNYFLNAQLIETSM